MKYNELIEAEEHLEHAYYAPLNVKAVGEEAFECSECGELMVWNKKKQKLQCFNVECSLYKGEEQ